jgi:glycosyltransferase involved in cell wall biosynthesis
MRKIKGWDCNVVYTNTITVYVGAVAAKILKLPHIWHIREFGAEDHGFRFFFGEKATYRIIDLLSNNIIANSFSVSDKCKKHIHSSKIIVAYNPAILKQNAHSEKIKIFTEYNNCFKCMIAGTLSEGKRQEEAIRGINEVIREGYNVKLYIIGKGAKKTENKLKKLVVNLGIEKNVIFTGYLENAAALMRYIDAVLVCSRNEAYGRVTIEAMRNGKPVVGAKSGGTRELVENAKNGLLYIPGDYIDLAKKVKFLVTHREIAKDMGLKGGKWVQKNITAQIYRDQILELLHDTVNTP